MNAPFLLTLFSIGCMQPLEPKSPDTASTESDTGWSCPVGVTCVDSFPFRADLDTTNSSLRDFDTYACASSTDESGPEFVFQVEITERSFLGVAIDDSTDGVDIDAHILQTLSTDDCLDRGNTEAGAVVEPGTYYVVTDTYVSSSGEQSGLFGVTIGAYPLHSGSCEMESGWLDRVGDDGQTLEMPATGPLAMEAHLVTTDDGYGSSPSDPWPQSITESIPEHYRLSEDATGFVMARNQPWAPQEGCEYGQGACGSKLPSDEEAWYVNMYWADRPDGGTRMILRNAEGRTVVVAAGYETGPGNLDYIGGTVEEVHHYLGTGHGSPLTLGFALDDSLPLGPIECD